MSASVAVLIPTHNRSELLQITLDNVLCQEGVDLQIAVIDDGGNDETESVMRNRKDSRLVFERFPQPRGAPAARNRAQELTDAEYICYLDSDDLLHPEKLVRQVNRLAEDPTLDLVVCQMANFDEDPNGAEFLWNTFAKPDFAMRFLGHDPPWGVHAPLWRRSAIERIGGFKVGLPVAQDFEFHTRAMLLGCKAAVFPDLLTYARKHTGPSISSTTRVTRLQTLLAVFDDLYGLVEQPNEKAKQVMIGNYLWLANQSAIQKQADLMSAALGRARDLVGGWNPTLRRFGLLTRAALLTGRHRFHVMAGATAEKMGHRLEDHQSWYMTFRIDDEPGIVRYEMPSSCWRPLG